MFSRRLSCLAERHLSACLRDLMGVLSFLSGLTEEFIRASRIFFPYDCTFTDLLCRVNSNCKSIDFVKSLILLTLRFKICNLFYRLITRKLVIVYARLVNEIWSTIIPQCPYVPHQTIPNSLSKYSSFYSTLKVMYVVL